MTDSFVFVCLIVSYRSGSFNFLDFMFVSFLNYDIMSYREFTVLGGIEMRKNRALLTVLALCWITYVFAYLCRLNLSTVLDKTSVGLNVSVEYLGIASSLYFGTYAVGQLLNGIVGDRVSPHKFIVFALLLTGSINVILGLQTNGAAFLVLWGMNGFCQSMFWSTLLRLLSFYSGPDEKKRVSTVMTTCSVTGYFLSWIVLGYTLKPFTFSPYFLIPGALALCLVPVWIVLSGKLEFSKAVAQRGKTPPLPVVAKEFVHDRLYFVCILGMMVGAIREGAVFWMPTIFASVLNLGSDSLLYLMLMPIAMLSGVFLAQWVLGVFKDNVRNAVLATVCCSVIIAMLLVLTSGKTSLLTVVLIALLIATVNASNWFNISYFPLCFSERNIVSTLIGTFDFSSYIGASIMSGTVGVILGRFGWAALTCVWLALTLLELILALTGAGKCFLLKGEPRS